MASRRNFESQIASIILDLQVIQLPVRVTGQEVFNEGSYPWLNGFHYVRFNWVSASELLVGSIIGRDKFVGVGDGQVSEG